MQYRFKFNIFSRYLVSYIIILAIPLFTLGIVNYNYINSYFVNEIVDKKNYSLQNAKTALDMQVKQLNHIALQYTTNKDFYTYYLESYAGSFYGIQLVLKNQKSINSFTYDMLFYNKHTDRLYSTDSVYALEYYDHKICDYEDYSAQTIRNIFSNIRKSGWIPLSKVNTISGPNEILTYFIPVERNGTNVSSAAVFQIEKQTIDKLVAGITPNDKTLTLLYYNGEQIYSSISITNTMKKQLEDLLQYPAESSSLQRFDNSQYFLYSIKSSDSGITYVCLIPHSQVMDEIQNLMILLGIALSAIVVISIVIIMVLMRLNYSPLKKLGSFAKNVLGSIPNNLNDIEAAQYAITNLSESNRAITSFNHQILQERLLLNLLRGDIKDLESFHMESKDIDVHLNGPGYQVAVLALEDWHESGLTSLIRQLEEVTEPSLDVYSVEYLEKNSIILIVSGEIEDINDLPDKLHFLSLHFTKNLKINCTIGIGNPAYTLTEIVTSYRQASIAVRNKNNIIENIILYSDLAASGIESYNHPTEELNALYNAILSGNTAKIEFVTSNLIQVLNTTTSLFLGICLCYDIINMSLKSMRDLNRTTSTPMEKYREMVFKTEVHSVSELVKLVQGITSEIIVNINSGGSNKAVKDVQVIVNYIEMHFAESSFSVKTLADHFNMSVSNLSHYFKSRMGHNVSDYINLLRFNEAKKLLSTTELPISEIVTQIGYFQVSSFINKFRKLEGVTPGEYRMLMKKKN